MQSNYEYIIEDQNPTTGRSQQMSDSDKVRAAKIIEESLKKTRAVSFKQNERHDLRKFYPLKNDDNENIL